MKNKIRNIAKISTFTVVGMSSVMTGFSFESQNLSAQVKQGTITIKNQGSQTIPFDAKVDNHFITNLDDALKWLNNNNVSVSKDQVINFTPPMQGQVKYLPTNASIPNGFEQVGNTQTKIVNEKNDELEKNNWYLTNKIEGENKQTMYKIPANAMVNNHNLKSKEDVIEYLKQKNVNVSKEDIKKLVLPTSKTTTQTKILSATDNENELLRNGWVDTLKTDSSYIDDKNGVEQVASGTLAPTNAETQNQYITRLNALGYKVNSFNPSTCENKLTLKDGNKFNNEDELKRYLTANAHNVRIIANISQELSNMQLNLNSNLVGINSWNELFTSLSSSQFAFDYGKFLIKNGLVNNEFNGLNLASMSLSASGLPTEVEKLMSEHAQNNRFTMFVSDLFDTQKDLDDANALSIANHMGPLQNAQIKSNLQFAVDYYNKIVDALNVLIQNEKNVPTGPFNHARISIISANGRSNAYDNLDAANQALKANTNNGSWIVKTANGTVVKTFSSQQDANAFLQNQKNVASQDRLFGLTSEPFLPTGETLANVISPSNVMNEIQNFYNNLKRNTTSTPNVYTLYRVGGKYFASQSEANTYLNQLNQNHWKISLSDGSVISEHLSSAQVDSTLNSFSARVSASGQLLVDGKVVASLQGSGSEYYKVYDPQNKLHLSDDIKNKQFSSQQALNAALRANLNIAQSADQLSLETFDVRNPQIEERTGSNLVLEQGTSFSPYIEVNGFDLNYIFSKAMDSLGKPLIASNGKFAVGDTDTMKNFFSEHNELLTTQNQASNQRMHNGFKFLTYVAPTIDELLQKLHANGEIISSAQCTLPNAKIVKQIHPKVFTKTVTTNTNGIVTINSKQVKYEYSRIKVQSLAKNGQITFKNIFSLNQHKGSVHGQYAVPTKIKQIKPRPTRNNVPQPVLPVQKTPGLIVTPKKNQIIPTPIVNKVPQPVLPVQKTPGLIVTPKNNQLIPTPIVNKVPQPVLPVQKTPGLIVTPKNNQLIPTPIVNKVPQPVLPVQKTPGLIVTPKNNQLIPTPIVNKVPQPVLPVQKTPNLKVTTPANNQLKPNPNVPKVPTPVTFEKNVTPTPENKHENSPKIVKSSNIEQQYVRGNNQMLNAELIVLGGLLITAGIVIKKHKK